MKKFDLKKMIAENKATFFSTLNEGFQGQFYAPEYLEQKYGKEMASKIEAEIEDMDLNAWDRFTGMESAKEVEDYISDIKDMMDLNEGTIEEAYNSYTFKVAKNFAKYMSKKEGKDFEVTMNSVDEYSFDLDLDGEPYAGGSYLIQNGNIHNVAIPGNPIYATTDDMEDYIGEGYDEFKRADKGSKGVTAKNKGEEEVYGAGVKKGEEIEKKKLSEAPMNKEAVAKKIVNYFEIKPESLEKFEEFKLDGTDDIEDLTNFVVSNSKPFPGKPLTLDQIQNTIEGFIKQAISTEPSSDEVYPYGLGRGQGYGKSYENKTKMKKSDLKAKIKEMIVAEMELDVQDTAKEAGEYDFLAELESMLDETEEDFSVELLVPTVYFNPETGELAETPAAFGADSELEDMGITNYSDGDELSEWVFDNNIEKAKYFEKEYPGLFKVEDVMNEAKDEEVDAEEIDVTNNITTDEPSSPGKIDVTQNANADLTGDKKSVQDNLEAALEAAKALGDEKLATQIGNSLTFFTKQHVVKEEETLNESMFPMLKRILK